MGHSSGEREEAPKSCGPIDYKSSRFFFKYVISVDVTDRLFLPRNWFIAMFDYRDRKIYKNGLEHNLRADLK